VNAKQKSSPEKVWQNKCSLFAKAKPCFVASVYVTRNQIMTVKFRNSTGVAEQRPTLIDVVGSVAGCPFFGKFATAKNTHEGFGQAARPVCVDHKSTAI